MRVDWSLNALADLERVKEYIGADSEFYALRLVEGAFDAVKILSDFPKIGRIVPELGQENLRELVFGSYRIMYSVGEETVTILTVVHAMRNFTGL